MTDFAYVKSVIFYFIAYMVCAFYIFLLFLVGIFRKTKREIPQEKTGKMAASA